MKRFTSFLAAFFMSIAAVAQNYGMVDISVCNMRETPNYSAEMVSQALLGTPVEILQYGGEYGWPEVKTPDGYTGWVHKDAIVAMTAEQLHQWNHGPLAVVTALTGLVYEGPSAKSAVVSDVVGGDRLKLLGKCAKYLKVQFPGGRIGYISKADAKELDAWRKGLDNSAGGILRTALSMRGFPYIWAGMSPKGMDCSGYVRAVLAMHDIIIPRDAGPQSGTGELIDVKDALEPGDLVFFGRWNGDLPRVSHVGFYLGEGRFIHSLGLVKIGSFNADDPLYDAYNTGRYLFGTRIIPFTDPRYSTTENNPLYTL
jgi:uncharacterized protein YgiM (DUF1202 family)